MLRGLEPDDRPRLADLLAQVDAFTDDERAVALELVDVTLASPQSDDYRFLLATPDEDGGQPLLGYLCYGRTPITRSTYDLYWIATAPEHARKGVARSLVAAMERQIAGAGGGLVRVETGSREGHGAAVRFYDSLGFHRSALIEGFYAPDDDLLIFTHRVAADTDAGGELPVHEEALVDLAFGYRDWAAERDFFLACARRFGGREVRRVLAWECGAGRHLAAFADVGIGALGVDGSEGMIAHARSVLGPARLTGPRRVELERSPLTRKPEALLVDLSFVPLSAIHELATPDAMVEHLRAAASTLAPGGLHIVEATHPQDLSRSGAHHTEWTEVRRDVVLHARLRMHIDRAIGRKVPVTLEVVAEPRKSGARGSLPALRREDVWYVPTLDEFRAMIARVPELSLVATTGDFNVDVPFEHPAAWRLLLVLRRA